MNGSKQKDTKEVIRGGKSKWTQCNGQPKIDKRTNNQLRNNTQNISNANW
jgi:hypothetical protein